MSKIPIVWFERTDEALFYLRRFRAFDTSAEERKCSDPHGYCNAMVLFDRAKRYAPPAKPSHADQCWPTVCQGCGRAFGDDDEYQVFSDAIYRDASGRELPLRELPAGAVYNASWYPHDMQGPDGRSLMVVLPGGLTWCIDGEASNCTRRNDHTHKCWVRHGRPEDGTLHVDKRGNTCSAGAGSISVPGYHGFLHHGHLVQC